MSRPLPRAEVSLAPDPCTTSYFSTEATRLTSRPSFGAVASLAMVAGRGAAPSGRGRAACSARAGGQGATCTQHASFVILRRTRTQSLSDGWALCPACLQKSLKPRSTFNSVAWLQQPGRQVVSRVRKTGRAACRDPEPLWSGVGGLEREVLHAWGECSQGRISQRRLLPLQPRPSLEGRF